MLSFESTSLLSHTHLSSHSLWTWRVVSASQLPATVVTVSPSPTPVSNQPPPISATPPSCTAGFPNPTNPPNRLSSFSTAWAPTQCGNGTNSSPHLLVVSTSTFPIFSSSVSLTRLNPIEPNIFKLSVLLLSWKRMVWEEWMLLVLVMVVLLGIVWQRCFQIEWRKLCCVVLGFVWKIRIWRMGCLLLRILMKLLWFWFRRLLRRWSSLLSLPLLSLSKLCRLAFSLISLMWVVFPNYKAWFFQFNWYFDCHDDLGS